ncbi:MAG: hypothetical protein D6791_17300 [Chloroflexi bacterium]|nr:MAG: hypothetical protein D6791_17300 [Chloroflexota bacterium]
MPTIRSSPSFFSDRPQPPDSDPPPPAAWGCAFLFALVFIIAGLLPFLALLNIFPRDEYFGGQSPFPIVASALGFIAVGIYLMGNVFRSAAGLPRFSGRILADIVAFSLALPFHWWLFFGTAAQSSATGITLPGGITIFTTTNLPIDFILAKIVVAVICIILDLVLISEVFGLGWFTWTSGDEEG